MNQMNKIIIKSYFKIDKSKLYLQKRGLATIELDGKLGSPGPALL